MNSGTVVALHSLFFNGAMFDQTRSCLPEFRFITPDHRGQGSRAADPGQPSLERLARDTVRLVRDLDCGPVHLVGSSMGAYVAVRAAAEEPALFKTCTLSAASGDAEQRPEHFARLVSDLRQEGPASMVEEIAYTMFGDSFLAEGSPELLRWKDHFKSLPGSVADAAQEVFSRDSLWPLIDEVQVPLFLIAGAEDHAKPPEHMFRIALRRPGSFLTVVPNAGHTPFVERPRHVAGLLRHAFALEAPIERD